LWRIRSTRPTVVLREVSAFWVTYRVPQYALTQTTTTIALNVGSGLVPIVVTLILLKGHPGIWRAPSWPPPSRRWRSTWSPKVVDGVWVVAPTLVPPIAAVLFSVPFGGSNLAVTAYIAGTLGTLIGADLSSLGRLSEGGTSVASIGGAGKFDGIFLTGIAAVLIASLV
jgi:uncharacterized membrane protein